MSVRLQALCALGLLLGMSTAALAEGGPAEGCVKGSDAEGFWKRLSQSYQKHLFPSDEPSPPADPNAPFDEQAAGYRKDVQPPPVSNPPWPYSTWNMGGSPQIGYENIYASALMDAIYCGSNGKAWKDSRFTIYGWIEPGGNVSTSNHELQQADRHRRQLSRGLFLRIPIPSSSIRLPCISSARRTKSSAMHNDWGFRVALLYGTDYKYTFSNGIMSYQYTEEERLYGFDPVMYYLDFYFPHFFEGENVRVGRYISIPDIEAQLAPNNITYSHSLLYTV